MLRIAEISDYNEFKNYREPWDDFLKKSPANNIFLTYDWIDACIRHFCMDERLMILNVFKGERLIGIAPLMIKRYTYLGIRTRSVCFIGTGVSDRMDFILEEDKEAVMTLMLNYIMKLSSEWDIVDLQEIMEDTGTIDMAKKWLSDKNISNLLGPSFNSFLISFNGNNDILSQKFSNRFYRKLRKAKKRNPALDIKCDRYMNGDIAAKCALSDINTIIKNSWQGRTQRSIFSKSSIKDFHREIFDRFCEKGWVDLATLKANGQPIAYVYNYLYMQRAYNYSMEFDKRYAYFSPGTTLMFWLLSDSVPRDISEFDFGKGDEPWKSGLTRSFKPHTRLRIFRDTRYGRVLRFLCSELVPFLKRNKIIHRVLSGMKQRIVK